MSHWNYRVLHSIYVHESDNYKEHHYAIHEVYYNDNGDPKSCTVNSVGPSGETLEELKSDLENYTKALSQPVLEYDDIGSKKSGKRVTSNA